MERCIQQSTLLYLLEQRPERQENCAPDSASSVVPDYKGRSIATNSAYYIRDEGLLYPEKSPGFGSDQESRRGINVSNCAMW